LKDLQHHPSCCHCKKDLSSHEDLRVQVKGIHMPPTEIEKSAQYQIFSFCADPTCLLLYVQNVEEILPKFDKLIGLAPHLTENKEFQSKVLVSKDHFRHSGIDFVETDNYFVDADFYYFSGKGYAVDAKQKQFRFAHPRGN